MAYLGQFSAALQTQQRAEEVSEVERLLARPLVPFAALKQKVPSLPVQNEFDESKEQL